MAQSEKNLVAVFTDTANAIRAKKQSVAEISPLDFADEVASIPTGIEPTGEIILYNNDKHYDVTDKAQVFTDVWYVKPYDYQLSNNFKTWLDLIQNRDLIMADNQSGDCDYVHYVETEVDEDSQATKITFRTGGFFVTVNCTEVSYEHMDVSYMNCLGYIFGDAIYVVVGTMLQSETSNIEFIDRPASEVYMDYSDAITEEQAREYISAWFPNGIKYYDMAGHHLATFEEPNFTMSGGC